MGGVELTPPFLSVPKPSRSRARASQPRPAARVPSAVRTPVAVLAILACGLVAYANSFSGLFVFDDEPAIVQNAHITRLWPLTAAMAAPEGTTASGRPMVSLSLALNYALASAMSYIIFVVIAVVTALQFRLLRERT